MKAPPHTAKDLEGILKPKHKSRLTDADIKKAIETHAAEKFRRVSEEYAQPSDQISYEKNRTGDGTDEKSRQTQSVQAT